MSGSNQNIKTYGEIKYNKASKQWVITEAQPHVCIKLKNIFPKIPVTSTVPFYFNNLPETCADLLWFISRYPLVINKPDLARLHFNNTAHLDHLNKLETLFLPKYVCQQVALKDDYKARNYQIVAKDLLVVTKRYLLGDDLGLGKTLSGILGFTIEGALPAAVICDTNLTRHWEQQIAKFTSLKTHVIKTRSAYSLPENVDVYIYSYSKLSGWVDLFKSAFFKYALFDEIQELRHSGTDKYMASNVLSTNASYAIGLSATPIYNNAIEMYNILNLLKEGCLGKIWDFEREWQNGSSVVKEPQALGSYLRDNYLFLRRTREDVGMELPKINTIIHEVAFDHEEVEKQEDLLLQLAVAATSGTFTERGAASRELDLRLRHLTGVSKARYVAAYVKMLLLNGESVLLAGWHRDVYEIWAEELEEFNPCWYTGTETPKGKNESKEAFESGESKLMIISLRSGKGIDGLQTNCSIIVHGELDWSPQVHNQITGRIDRPGQTKPVMSIYLISESGSDPAMVAVLGLKASQAHNIVNPYALMPEQYSDENRIKLMAQSILDKHKHSKVA